MSILLFLLAFPGLAVVATAFWARAARRYQAHMQRVASYPDPSIDEVIDHGLIPVYRRASKAESEMDAAARSGALGPEAQRLQRVERRSFFLVGLMIPMGMALAVVLGWLLAPLETTIDIEALAVVIGGALAFIGAVCAYGEFVAFRAGRRAVGFRYLIGIASLIIGGYIGLVGLLNAR